MGLPENIVVGSHIWIEDAEHVWIDGEVVSISGNDAEVQISDGRKVVAKLSKLCPKDMDAPAGGYDDMTKLSYLHEAGVLHNLSTRYQIDEIYTYTGNILIAINPFQSLPDLYDEDTMKRYKGAQFGELRPHVFSIADAAYRAMVIEGKSNSILVSGESGAGKTETTKMLMRYLAFLGGHSAAEGLTVEKQVLESNPVLEAFGNAKTVRNNNSSRFGKFVEIQFDKCGRISGAAIRTYLLERSRVCQISDFERNYHCFYLLCAAPPEEREKYKLQDPKSFHYLNQSNCYDLVGVDASHDYLSTRKAMATVGINQEEQDAIFRIVAAILHLGNINFGKGEDVDSSLVEDEESKFHLQTTADLLMCDRAALEDALCKRVMITPEEIIKRSLDPVGAMVSRDGLAKTIYSRLFDWLVKKINVSIGQDPMSKCLIGVLDIYGFESFEINSFEQFCINFTNEKLQQHFNQHVFKMEQQEYTQEEIDWSYLEFVDNQDVLDLIEKKPGGIISLLDEACMFPKSTHETFSQKLYQTFKSHRRFIKPKLARSEFTIVHYAGEVKYQSDQFLDKNKDYVVPEHQDLLSASKCSFVAGLFPPLSEETAKTSKFSSIGSRFKLQLNQLMEILNSTEPHYIRCVKPNSLLKAAIFENINVMQQLRSGGVLEAVRIKCAGYPTHRTFPEFLTRFEILAPEVPKGNFEQNEACKKILEKVDLTGYQIGKTKVFLRAGQMAELDARRSGILGSSASVIQRQFRTHVTHKTFIALRDASICVQSYCRGQLAQTLYVQMKRKAAAGKIQKNFRGHLARKTYIQIKFYVILLQTGFRAMSARNELRNRKKTKASIDIQVSEAEVERETCTVRDPVVENGSCEIGEPIVENGNCELGEPVAENGSCTLREHALVNESHTLIDEDVEKESSNMREPTLAVHNAGSVEALTAEVRHLKAMLQAEKQRADDCDRKYAQAQESSQEIRKKLQETEKRVYQLQDSLNRMICSMSNQVSELKTILSTSSRLSSTFRPIARVDVASSNSDSSSTDSDFTFPAPVTKSVKSSTPNPKSVQLVVRDITTGDASGSESDKEGSFDDFF